ncbi:MAG: Ig-like domain-containing protein, partial [Gemmatimonadales bacterium]
RRVHGWVFSALLVAPVIAACSERERITSPDPGDGFGPVVTITEPESDTTVTAGPGVFVAGHVLDNDGVDTLYIEVVNGNQSFNPLTFDKDSVRFDLPISTSSMASGDSMIVVLFGVDAAGTRGAPAERRLFIK